jgi:NADPH-dependent 2,4-dienoyl-CoA reductase/sulfur reductase-like enzyme
MPEPAGFTIDGRAAACESGITVAAALENAGQSASRRSVSGQRRGVLCAMGVCFECRVTIDGVPHRRACMELVRDGMEVWTQDLRLPAPVARFTPTREALACDVAVVGAGPAGIAAACRASESGARTLLLDEGLAAGGQIYRRRPGQEAPAGARAWIARLSRSGADVRYGAAVFDAVAVDAGFRLVAETGTGGLEVRAKRLVLATGARELFLPFPGWTLPGVMGAAGAQALWKSGGSLAGRRAVIAGTGPLLLPVAASLAKAGAQVVLVAEQASFGALLEFGASLWRSPGKLAEAARYRAGFSRARYLAGTWIAEALGGERVEAVVVHAGARRFTVACDLAAVGYGLVPNTELARLSGCEIRDGAVAVGETQESSVPGLFCAGEPCGIAGVEAAIAEGQIAGLGAAGRFERSGAEGRRLLAARARFRRFAEVLARTFALRNELRSTARPDTIVCRCEDARLGDLAACGSAREAKLSARAGMGPCQGRVCGPALGFLFGWASDSVRPPVKPASLASLAGMEEPA